MTACCPSTAAWTSPACGRISSHLEGDRWVNDACQPLWGHQSVEGVTRTDGGAVAMFQTLRFGAPSITRLPDGTLYVAFWCYEDCVSIIRWFKFRID